MVTPQRALIQSRFREVCEKAPCWHELPYERRAAIIRRAERNCFEVAINECQAAGINRTFTEPRFIERYSSVCYKVLSNLDIAGPVSSSYLIEGLIAGTIDPYTVAEQSSATLCPAANEQERATIERRQNQVAAVKVSRLYTCSKCGANETIPIKYQGRAADEDCSISIRCVHCSFVWRKR